MQINKKQYDFITSSDYYTDCLVDYYYETSPTCTYDDFSDSCSESEYWELITNWYESLPSDEQKEIWGEYKQWIKSKK